MALYFSHFASNGSLGRVSLTRYSFISVIQFFVLLMITPTSICPAILGYSRWAIGTVLGEMLTVADASLAKASACSFFSLGICVILKYLNRISNPFINSS